MRCLIVTEIIAIFFLALLTSVRPTVNLARGKHVTASSNQNPGRYNVSYTVDGNTSQSPIDVCFHTAHGRQASASWRVDLGEVHNVEKIKIYYRDTDEVTLQRFIGYQLYYSNTSTGNVPSGEICYSNEGKPAPPSIVEHDCDYLARYVTVYKRRQNNVDDNRDGAILELCEVEIYGCPVGKFGNKNCISSCSGCHRGACNSTTGVCKDEACIYGFYGPKCNQNCPQNCKNKECNFKTGTCVDSGCNIGYYGVLCSKSCSKACKNKICNFRSGICYGCEDGYFGETCNINCPGNCDRCDFISGECEVVTAQESITMQNNHGDIGIILGSVSLVLLLVSILVFALCLRRIQISMGRDSSLRVVTNQRKATETYDTIDISKSDTSGYQNTSKQ